MKNIKKKMKLWNLERMEFLMNTLIKLSNITKDFPMGRTIVHALRGVDLSLETGGYYSIVGPSGSGKSTLLHILGIMDAPSTGEMWIGDKSVHGLSERERTIMRAQYIGFIFQAFHLNPILNARDNVAIALEFLGENRRKAINRAEAWLDCVGLCQRLFHYPAELSGGERQRVAIARALVKEPLLVLADEPTGNLDSHSGHEIITLLRQINRQGNATIVQVTHDSEIAALSDKTIFFRDGRVLN